jgi:GntR family transcriptional regulator
MIMIDHGGDRALYRQLADILRGKITDGELQPGQSLPSEGTLAQEYGLGRDTVRDALALLRSEGLVATERGKGTFVRVPEAVTTLTLKTGDSLVARMPTPEERQTLGLPKDGVPVLVIDRANGKTEVHGGDRTRVHVGRR